MSRNLSPVNEMQDSITSSSPSEIVYGGTGSPDEHRTMSDKVQTMASAIYRELEMMIKDHGEQGVKTLMPLVVNVLESLDLAYLERDEQVAEIEMLKEDNEQLQTQYEREKQLRKQTEQKYIEIEDSLVSQNKDLDKKVESLESIMRMLELKAKNATDHANRMEERESEQKMEFERLHERYNALLRTHVDHMERTKYLMGTDKFEMMQNMPLPNLQLRNKLGMASSVDASTIRGVSDLISAHMTQSTTMDVNLANHINTEDWGDEFPSDVEPSPRDVPAASMVEATNAEPASPAEVKAPQIEAEPPKIEHGDEEEQDGETDKEQKASAPDALGADLTDETEWNSLGLLPRKHPTSTEVDDYGVDDSYETGCEEALGMGREVENLIKENSELMDMKNALNVVKNDLINQVDQLQSELLIVRDESHSRHLVCEKLAEQNKKLEDEMKELRQRLAEKEEEEEDDVPMSMRKRFTRSEMQRVLMDRNAYKEKLMELEETVKWTEMQRAKKIKQQQQNVNQKKGTGIWDFFSGLFGESVSPPVSARGPARSRGNKMARSMEYIDPDMSVK